ncbi:MAG: polyether ionophore transport system permease protein [Actinomycetota bacterium]|jgi:ABC-2 type transport system permease protein
MSGPQATLLGHELRLQRRQATAWIIALALVGLSGVAGYRAAYPTQAARDQIARTVAANPAFNALYGTAHHLETTTGFAAWRVGGVFVIIGAVWGLLAATRLTRGEEEAGRSEIVAAGATTAGARLRAELLALALVYGVAWVAVSGGLIAGGTPAGGAGLVALVIVGGAVAFAAVGAATAELFDTRRAAAGVAGAVLGASALLRIVADGSALSALRWATPLGWAEEIRPADGGRPLPVLLLVLWTAGWVTVAAVARARRDLGAGLVVQDARPHTSVALLGSPEGFGLRSVLGVTMAWTAGLAAMAAVLGSLARDVANFTAGSADTERVFERLGVAGAGLPVAFLALAFTTLLAPIAFYGVSLVVGARHEESAGRLELLLAGAVGRRRWLAGRITLAVVMVVAISVAAGVAAWLGTRLHPVAVSLPSMIKAGANCVPAVLVFVALTAGAFAFVPRLTAPAAYGAVLAAYTIEIVGQLLSWPGWVLGLSPFHHVAAVPLQPVDVRSTAALVGVAGVLSLAAVWRFGRRDLAVG